MFISCDRFSATHNRGRELDTTHKYLSQHYVSKLTHNYVRKFSPTIWHILWGTFIIQSKTSMLQYSLIVHKFMLQINSPSSNYVSTVCIVKWISRWDKIFELTKLICEVARDQWQFKHLSLYENLPPWAYSALHLRLQPSPSEESGSFRDLLCEDHVIL